MEEIQYILANKIAQLNENFGNKDVQYNDDYKASILGDIETIIQDICVSRGYVYTAFKFNTDAALFEVKDMLYDLVVTILFRNRDVKIFLNCFKL